MLAASGGHVLGQEQKADPLLRAMQDELDRNLKGLRQPGFDAPFFIMYGVQDQRTFSIGATLGSLTLSSETRQRFRTNTRVLVGDYAFNDESLEDDLFSSPTALEINLPIDDDYAGIRRSFWSATDQVYREAARHFKKHQETLKETGKTLEEIPHRSFAKAGAVMMLSRLDPYALNKNEWESRVKELSALFLKDPSIQNSGVMMMFVEGHRYLVNSEGTVARLPFRSATLFIGAQSRKADGEFVMTNSFQLAETPDEFPTQQELMAEVDALIEDLKKQAELSSLDEEYTGPVLLLGQPVASTLVRVLFDGPESVMANDNIAKLTGYQFDNNVISMDSKIGRSILHESVTIAAKPNLKSYNDTKLFGGFAMDDEGIVPPDELVLVENGVLRNLLNNRTITHPSQTANGFSSGPGVLEISVSKKQTEAELREMLIAKAKEEGLDYAIIVRGASDIGIGTMNVYKVSVADGSEELLRNGVFTQPNMKTMRRIVGATEKYSAYNLGGRAAGFGPSRDVVSVICPEGLLVEEMDIAPFRMPTLREEEYVSNPLLAGEQ